MMALGKSFMSWLRGSNKEKNPEDPAAVDSTIEEQIEEKSLDEVAAPDIPVLRLASDHALYRLHRLWADQYIGASWPALRLEDPGVIPNGWQEKELQRLQSAITTAANSRLAKATPKPTQKQKADEASDETADPPPPDLDALPWIFLPVSRLAAWLMIFPPVGNGKPVDSQMLAKCLKDAEVSFGVNQELVEQLPAEKNCYFRLVLIAQGQPPQDGTDGRIVDFFARVIEKKVAVDEFGQVDYTALNLIQNANQGDPICQLIPHTDGIPGTTVQGKEIPAKNGKKVTLPKGRNTEVNEDGTKLLATLTGHVEFSGRTFQVRPVLDISGSVDYSTGNINFLGDVHIRGDVCTGFTVRAMGSVRVDGVVEGAVEAGGDLIVAKGILGSQQAIVRSHRSIFAKYMESSSIHAQENLQTDCIVNCNVYSDGMIEVTTGRGTIIGGTVCAGRGVSAKIVGSKSESQTTVVLGGLPCAEFERELLVKEIADLEHTLEATERQPDGPVKLSRMSKTRMKISVNKLKLEQMNRELAELKKNLEEEGKAYMECDIAYPGTEIVIGSVHKRLDQETHKCVARLSDGGEIRLF